jgi:hypothetical protein
MVVEVHDGYHVDSLHHRREAETHDINDIMLSYKFKAHCDAEHMHVVA